MRKIVAPPLVVVEASRGHHETPIDWVVCTNELPSWKKLLLDHSTILNGADGIIDHFCMVGLKDVWCEFVIHNSRHGDDGKSHSQDFAFLERHYFGE